MKYMPSFIIDNSVEPNKLIITKVNESYIKIDAEEVIKQEISEYFTFSVPGAEFMPSYKNKMWDGKMRLYDRRSKKLYAGLYQYVLKFASERDYEVEVNEEDFAKYIFPDDKLELFYRYLDLKIEPRDYQTKSFLHCIKEKRALIVSPTASGKSFIIYLITQFLANKKILLIVPTISLVHQMKDDFIEYGMDSEDIHIIMSGKEKQSNERVVISTWQSIYQLKEKYFHEYDAVIGDECHLFTAKSLCSIMEKCINAKHRFGFTGTLDGSLTHKLVLEGLFGPVKKFVSTKDLIAQKHLSEFSIKCLMLKYPKDEIPKKKLKYADEMDFLVRHTRRNRFIMKLACNLEGNTLLLFQYVEKHGKILYDMISANTDRNVYLVYGATSAEDREKIRKIVEKEKDAIVVASYGTFSTGINIQNLHNAIFGSPSKSKIRNLQSIGRVLRKGNNKTKAALYDISDDLRRGKEINYTLNHFSERLRIYSEEGFEYKIININI